MTDDPTTPVRTRRRVVVTVLVTLALALPGTVLATHRFDDVATNGPFHEDIDALAAAGITSGCDADPPRYCPSTAVNRAQMAAFLHRALPRTVSDRGVTALNVQNDHAGIAGEVTIEAPGVAGGQNLVNLQASVTVYADGQPAGCPCEVEARIFRQSDGVASPSTWAQLSDQPANTGTTNAALPVSWVVPIDVGDTETYSVVVFVNGSPPGEILAEATLTAITAPFGGGSVSAQSSDDDPAPRRSRPLP